MERRFEADGEARAAARTAAEEDLLLNHAPDVRELPTVLEADLDASHDAGVLSIQCCPGAEAVITGSGAHLRVQSSRTAMKALHSLKAETTAIPVPKLHAALQGTRWFSGSISRGTSCGAPHSGAEALSA
jgi:hypothetical protein